MVIDALAVKWEGEGKGRKEGQVCHINALSQHESILVDATQLLQPQRTNGISQCCLSCSVSHRALESLLIFRAASLVAAL